MSYPVISLFSGAMGLDLGLMKAGLDVRVSQDVDPCCAKTMEANGHTYILGDIRKMVEEDPACGFLLDAAKTKAEDIFAVVGGPPCQSFSTAGKRMGINDPRGSLFMEFRHVVQTLRPRFFVMENVKGMLSAPIRPQEGEGEPTWEETPGSAFEIIKGSFEELGYTLAHGVLDAANYGAPQFRERLIIIGSRDGESVFLPEPTHFRIHQNPDYRWRTVKSAISDLEADPGECAKMSEERLKFIRMIPMGGNWRDLPEDRKKEAMGGAYHSGGGKTGLYRRLDLNQPAPTLLTSPLQKATMLCHPTQDRALSVKEYARIQQFPDTWKIEGKLPDKYRQIGNAVPVGLGEAIGQALLAAAEGTAEIKTKRMRGTSAHKKSQTL